MFFLAQYLMSAVSSLSTHCMCWLLRSFHVLVILMLPPLSFCRSLLLQEYARLIRPKKKKKVCTSEILLKSFHFLSTISAHCLLFLSRQMGYWALLSSICRSMTWWKHFSLKLVPLFGLKKLTWEWCWK